LVCATKEVNDNKTDVTYAIIALLNVSREETL